MLVRCLSSLVANSSSRVLLLWLASFQILCVESFLSLRCFPHRTTTNVAGPTHHQQQQPQNPCFRYSTACNIPQLFPSLRSAVFLWKQTHPIKDDEDDVILLGMQELQACTEMAPRDPTIAVARAESIFTQALASMANPTTTANKNNNNNNKYEDRRRDLYHALMATNAMAWSPNDNDNDDSAIERIEEILNDMVDGQGHPTPTDESYAWLLEAYLQRRDGQGAQQVWEALVQFEEAQPDFSLTPRLWKQHERIVQLQQQQQEQQPPH